MSGPLEGITILDFTRYQQGPSATLMLAELGARVLKVESPDGDPGRRLSRFADGFPSYFEVLNRGKQSIVVDLRHPDGTAVIARLARQVDVVAENFRPGVMDRLGVGYAALSAVNPRLIFASASMFGPRGPRTRHPGYDTIAQAAGGMVMATRRSGDDLGTPLGGTADQVGGMMLAYAILAALLHRERTGEGQKVDVSLLGSQLSLQMVAAARALYKHTLMLPQQTSGRISGSMRCSDDHWIAFGHLNTPQWVDVLRAFALGELVEDPRFMTAEVRGSNMPQLRSIIQERAATQPSDYWLKRLVEADIPCTLVQDYDMLAQDPQALENSYLYTYEHPRFGTLKAVGPVASFSKTGSVLQGPAPGEPGQHTQAILANAGFTSEEIAQLRANKVVS
jgi:crotonobetainyl-CoA:carnitine CoA-transferase CaiB-like acyl-CoA transferase